jgi:hypothetical protein
MNTLKITIIVLFVIVMVTVIHSLTIDPLKPPQGIVNKH